MSPPRQNFQSSTSAHFNPEQSTNLIERIAILETIVNDLKDLKLVVRNMERRMYMVGGGFAAVLWLLDHVK